MRFLTLLRQVFTSFISYNVEHVKTLADFLRWFAVLCSDFPGTPVERS